MSARELKDVAAEHFRKGRFAKAAESFLVLTKQEPQEPQHLIKLGDSYRRDGQRDPAIEAYTRAVDAYAKRGIVIKAIAACKLIIEIDPSRKDAQEQLAKLCAKRYVRRADAAPISLAPPRRFQNGVTDGSDVPIGKEISPPDNAPRWMREEVYVPTRDPAELAPEPVTPGGVVSDSDFSTGPLSAARRAAKEGAAPKDLGLEMAAAHRGAGKIEELLPEGVIDEPALASIEIATAESTGEQELMEVVADAAKRPATAMANILTQASQLDDPDSLPTPAEKTAGRLSFPTGGLDIPLMPEEVTSLPVQMAELDQASVPLFSELPRDAFLDLLEKLKLRRFAPGEVILREGEPGQSIFVLASGRAEVLKAQPSGPPLRLAVLEDGSFFGEMALLNGSPRVASVVALEECEILEMTEATLRDLTTRHPSVSHSLKKFYRQRLLQNVMAISPLFKGFDRTNRRMLVEKFKLREVNAGEAVITEGQPADGLYVIMHGAALVQKTDPKTSRLVPLAVLKEGDVFGEMSLLTHKAAGATVVTRRRSLILRLPKPTFDELMFTHPTVLEVVSDLSDQRSRVNEQILSGAIDVPREALAFL